MCEVHNTTILYTTHGLQEAERLCDRVAILIRGQTSCIGGLKELKRGIDGYKIVINCNDVTKENPDILEDLCRFFNINSTEINIEDDQLYFQVEEGEIRLSKIYEKLDFFKEKKEIDDFWVSEKDLNDVFERCLEGNEAFIGNDDQEYGYNDGNMQERIGDFNFNI